MTKTAEEILNFHIQQINDRKISMFDASLNASKEFAAQEVGAYKAKLKEEVIKTFPLAYEITRIIDAVK